MSRKMSNRVALFLTIFTLVVGRGRIPSRGRRIQRARRFRFKGIISWFSIISSGVQKIISLPINWHIVTVGVVMICRCSRHVFTQLFTQPSPTQPSQQPKGQQRGVPTIEVNRHQDGNKETHHPSKSISKNICKSTHFFSPIKFISHYYTSIKLTFCHGFFNDFLHYFSFNQHNLRSILYVKK